ncbi:DUF4743 domain-containing protein [Telmatospirillum sp. J64-1]|uniref:DUF4743 domain-containing protein n=1 Tax=Telmatospirillum sp. J64-1 TaxID=2502183 RepID=UPI00115CD197|nr:DUF4743 domain-containing protein [Telmatospirillum sp. J64-1]
MSYLDHIHACNRFDLGNYRPFEVGGQRVGWVAKDFMLRLAAFTDIFRVRDDVVSLNEELRSPEERTEAVRGVLRKLVQEGVLPKMRGEDYDVAPRFGAEAVMRIDRTAVQEFGIRAYGLHVNGFVRYGEGMHLWIGKRALDKAVAPGKLDNLVAGGQPSGLSLAENLVKEAQEEADIPREMACKAKPVGVISYCMETERGLKPDVMFCYDLEVPRDFEPIPRDGEMTGFELMPVEKVAEIVRTSDAFKFNVNLVIIDFLIRHGYLTPENEPDYLDLAEGLRQPFRPELFSPSVDSSAAMR